MAAMPIPTIESFGLLREVTAPDGRKKEDDYESLFVGFEEEDLWADDLEERLFDEVEQFQIYDPAPVIAESGLNVEYSMHVELGTMIIFDIFLTDQASDVRWTDMRASKYRPKDLPSSSYFYHAADKRTQKEDLIADCWVQGGGFQPPGSRDGLAYLAWHCIVNVETDEAMRDEREAYVSAGIYDPASCDLIEWTPASPYWNDATFNWISKGIAEVLSTPDQEISVRRAFIIMRRTMPYNLLIEFQLGPPASPLVADLPYQPVLADGEAVRVP